MRIFFLFLTLTFLFRTPLTIIAAEFKEKKTEEVKVSTPPVFTPGKISVNYTRSSEGKNTYKGKTYRTPYRVAVWIEDENGKLLKTLYRSVGGKIEPFPSRLEHWEKKSGKVSDNTEDAYTGASSKGGIPEKSYSFSWDCKDEDGKVVPDGTYTYCVEVARYYQNGGNPPWKSGGPMSSLNKGKIKKGRFVSHSTGTRDAKNPSTLSALTANFFPK